MDKRSTESTLFIVRISLLYQRSLSGNHSTFSQSRMQMGGQPGRHQKGFGFRMNQNSEKALLNWFLSKTWFLRN